MGLKKINVILIVVSLALVVAFVGCLIYAFFNPEFSFVDTISAISAFFVAILTVITVYTTSKQMDFMKQQLKQMQEDQRLSEQPVLDVVSPKFEIERPRFYHSPEGYSFQSRYFFELQINNLSAYPAIFADISAELIVNQGKKERALGATSERVNVIAANTATEPMHIMFAGDSTSRILSALRSLSSVALPKLRLTITYKSLSGANYVLEHMYLIDIRDDEEDQSTILKNWHATISSGPIKEKETLEILKKTLSEEKHDEIYDLVKQRFNEELVGGETVTAIIVELPQNFSIKCVTDEQFAAIMEKHQYGRYIGQRLAECEIK